MRSLSSFFFLLLLFINLSLGSEENRIEWDEVEGAIQYNIQVRKDETLVIEKKTTDLYYQIELDTIGNYEYRIGAENKIGNSAWTEWKPLTLQKKELLKPELSKKKIELEWEESPQAVKYSVEIEDENGNSIYKKEVQSLKVYVNLPEGKYRYKVSATNQLGNVSDSNWESFQVQKKIIPKEELPKTITKEEQDSERWKVIRRSIILPGWGQYYRNDTRGRVLSYPIAFSILFPLYYLNFEKNKNAQNRYNSDINLLLAIQNTTTSTIQSFGTLTFIDSINARSEINSTYTMGNQLALLIAGIYILNLIDASFFYDYSKPISERPKTQIFFQSIKRPTNQFQLESYSELSIKFFL